MKRLSHAFGRSLLALTVLFVGSANLLAAEEARKVRAIEESSLESATPVTIGRGEADLAPVAVGDGIASDNNDLSADEFLRRPEPGGLGPDEGEAGQEMPIIEKVDNSVVSDDAVSFENEVRQEAAEKLGEVDAAPFVSSEENVSEEGNVVPSPTPPGIAQKLEETGQERVLDNVPVKVNGETIEAAVYAPTDESQRSRFLERLGIDAEDLESLFAGDPSIVTAGDTVAEIADEVGRTLASAKSAVGSDGGHNTFAPLATARDFSVPAQSPLRIPEISRLQQLAGVFSDVRPDQASKTAPGKASTIEELTGIGRKILGVPREESSKKIDTSRLEVVVGASSPQQAKELKANLSGLVQNALTGAAPAEDIPYLKNIISDPDSQAVLKKVLSSQDQAGIVFATALSDALNSLGDDDLELQNGLVQLASAVFPSSLELKFLSGNSFVGLSSQSADGKDPSQLNWVKVAQALSDLENSELDPDNKAFEKLDKEQIASIGASFDDFVKALVGYGSFERLTLIDPHLGAKVSEISSKARNAFARELKSFSSSAVYKNAKSKQMQIMKRKVASLKTKIKDKGLENHEFLKLARDVVDDDETAKLWSHFKKSSFTAAKRSVGDLYFVVNSQSVWGLASSKKQRDIKRAYTLANSYLKLQDAERMSKIIEDDKKIRALLSNEGLKIPKMDFLNISL